MTTKEAGQKGGQRTSETHGEEFYSEIGRKGAKVREQRKKEGLPPKPKRDPNKPPMSPQEAGRLGGNRTAETHGREFFEEIGRKGGEKVAAERGPEFYSEIGAKGSANRKNVLDLPAVPAGQRIRKLIQEGKEDP